MAQKSLGQFAFWNSAGYEELRERFFAQELHAPQPVSVKRLEKAWGQLNN